MHPHYVTAYQIAADPEITSFAIETRIGSVVMLAIAILAVCVFALGVFVYLRIVPKGRRLRWYLLIPCFGLVCVLAFCSFWVTVMQTGDRQSEQGEAKTLQAFRTGNYQVVEGPVTNFDPMPYEGHKSECFSVQDKRFCYSDYVITPGFRNTTSHGGPIHAGLQVQIAYITRGRHNVILRLKVADD